MPSAKINPLLYFNDEDKINEILTDLSVPIIALGLPSSIFTAKQAWNAFYMSKQYIKLVKFVSCYAEMGVLEDALNIGVTKGIISSPQECTATEFGKWAGWLNTKEGQEIIHDAQLTKKLKKSVAQGETIQQVAMFRAFCMMREDHGVSIKRARKEKDEELRGQRSRGVLRETLKKTEEKWEAEIMKINTDYGPVFAYHPPCKEEIDAAAYELYAAEAIAKGHVAVVRNLFVPGILAVDMYERRVYEADEKRHANNKIYEKEIEAYLARKIDEFRAQFDKKGKKKVRHLLGIIRGKEAVNDATATSKKRTRPE